MYKLARLFFIMLILIPVIGYSQNKYTLSIEFEGLKTDKGKLFVALYNSEEDFLKNVQLFDPEIFKTFVNGK